MSGHVFVNKITNHLCQFLRGHASFVNGKSNSDLLENMTGQCPNWKLSSSSVRACHISIGMAIVLNGNCPEWHLSSLPFCSWMPWVPQSVRYEGEVSCLAFYYKDAEYFVISNCEGTLDSFLVDNIDQNPRQISIINHLVSATDFPSKNLNSCHQLF